MELCYVGCVECEAFASLLTSLLVLLIRSCEVYLSDVAGASACRLFDLLSSVNEIDVFRRNDTRNQSNLSIFKLIILLCSGANLLSCLFSRALNRLLLQFPFPIGRASNLFIDPLQFQASLSGEHASMGTLGQTACTLAYLVMSMLMLAQSAGRFCSRVPTIRSLQLIRIDRHHVDIIIDLILHTTL